MLLTKVSLQSLQLLEMLFGRLEGWTGRCAGLSSAVGIIYALVHQFLLELVVWSEPALINVLRIASCPGRAVRQNLLVDLLVYAVLEIGGMHVAVGCRDLLDLLSFQLLLILSLDVSQVRNLLQQFVS